MGTQAMPDGAEAGVWSISIDGDASPFPCRTDQNLLLAMIAARRTTVKVGCRSGGCGVCRVRIVQGAFHSQKMTRSRISEADESEGIVLACRVMPQSDLAVLPLPLGVRAAG